MKIRTVIADDQVLARELLRRLLEEEPDIHLVGAAESGHEAVEMINRLRPDLVFLDVQMPDLDGFAVVRRLDCTHPPAVIFVTSNAEFALKAFEINAVDYLLKPCTARRLKIAVHRARELLRRGFLAIPDAPRPQDGPPKPRHHHG